MTTNAAYLKSQNLPWLFGFLVANLVVFVATTFGSLADIRKVFAWIHEHWEMLGVMGVGAVATTVLSNLVSPQLKAVLVFWRWPNPLPGHRAFTKYLGKDPRINPERLQARIGPFPEDPLEQNRRWYEIYRSHRDDPAVVGAHKDFLVTRDLAWLSFAFLVLLGGPYFVLQESAIQQFWYPGYLIAQFVITALSARMSGIRLVRNVLAVAAVEPVARREG